MEITWYGTASVLLLDHYDDAFPPVSELTPVDDFCRRMSAKVPTEKMMEGKRIKV
ncbi:MAG: hypothetical protein LUD01_06425 [Clostridiales bacterium]|nr:hypothetical protein [Clostridiales bacterium]